MKNDELKELLTVYTRELSAKINEARDTREDYEILEKLRHVVVSTLELNVKLQTLDYAKSLTDIDPIRYSCLLSEAKNRFIESVIDRVVSCN